MDQGVGRDPGACSGASRTFLIPVMERVPAAERHWSHSGKHTRET